MANYVSLWYRCIALISNWTESLDQTWNKLGSNKRHIHLIGPRVTSSHPYCLIVERNSCRIRKWKRTGRHPFVGLTEMHGGLGQISKINSKIVNLLVNILIGIGNDLSWQACSSGIACWSTLKLCLQKHILFCYHLNWNGLCLVLRRQFEFLHFVTFKKFKVLFKSLPLFINIWW